MSREQVNKFQRDLAKEDNTFKFEPEKPLVNRVEQVRRDNDSVGTHDINIYKIDNSIKWFIDNVIKPKVENNGQLLSVPVMYASPEKWASIQRQGFIRDDNGKILAPLISYSRTSVTKRADLVKNSVSSGNGNEIVMKSKYNSQNTYDKFSILHNQVPQEEYFTINVPDYVDVSYDFTIWADYTSQLNHIIEQILYFTGQAWGDTYKFTTNTDSFSFTTTNTSGEDRLVQATTTLVSKAYLLPEDAAGESNMKKQISVSKIVVDERTISNINNIPKK